jgi:hypothetical protein
MKFDLDGFMRNIFFVSRMKLILLLAFLAALSTNAEEYFQYNPATGLSKVEGDPKEANPTEWQLWTLGYGEQTHAGTKPCGLYVGSSAAEVMKLLKEGQKAEKDWEKATGLTETHCSFFNYVGPIAVYKQTDDCQERQAAENKLKEMGAKLGELHENYETAKGLAGEGEPSYQVGSVFKEYASQLETGLQLQAKLRAVLEETACSGVPKLNNDFEELQRDIDVAQQGLPALTPSKTNAIPPAISNIPATNAPIRPAHAAVPDDLPNPLQPSNAELNRSGSAIPAISDLNNADSPASPGYARNIASQSVMALGTLCGSIQGNTSQIQRLSQEIAKSEQQIKQLEWSKTTALLELRNALGQAGARRMEEKSWSFRNNYVGYGMTTDRVMVGADSVSASYVTDGGSEIYAVPAMHYWEIDRLGELTHYHGQSVGGEAQNIWGVLIILSGGSSHTVDFANEAEAQDFKQIMERNVAASRPVTQQDIDAKELEFDTAIANCRKKISDSQPTIARLEAENTESISQIRQGIRLWRTAVTFEETLIIQTSSTEFHAIQVEIKKIEAKLSDIRFEKTRATDPDKLTQLKRDEGLWESLLKQQHDRQKQMQQQVRQAVLQARELKLTEFRQISGCPGTTDSRWVFPQDELHYRPVSFREPDSHLGIEFKFGQLKSLTPDAMWPYSLPLVQQFIANFQATEPTVSLSEATGALAEGNVGDDETLLLQKAIPARETVNPQPKENDSLPLP